MFLSCAISCPTNSLSLLYQVDVVSPLQEVSLLVDKPLTQLAVIEKNLTSSISQMSGLSIRKSSLRPSGHRGSELRVYGLEGGAVLDGKELAVRLTSLPLAQFDIENIQLSDSGQYICQPAAGAPAIVTVTVHVQRETEVQAVLGEG